MECRVALDDLECWSETAWLDTGLVAGILRSLEITGGMTEVHRDTIA